MRRYALLWLFFVCVSGLLDVHGAGVQRSDPKAAGGGTYPAYFGPQGDVQYVYNYVRCVRNIN